MKKVGARDGFRKLRANDLVYSYGVHFSFLFLFFLFFSSSMSKPIL